MYLGVADPALELWRKDIFKQIPKNLGDYRSTSSLNNHTFFFPLKLPFRGQLQMCGDHWDALMLLFNYCLFSSFAQNV